MGLVCLINIYGRAPLRAHAPESGLREHPAGDGGEGPLGTWVMTAWVDE